MARLARVVAPGIPHHVTQRGNRRQQIFFSDDDYARYKALMAASCARRGVAVWAYCLMPDHVHLVVTPETAEGLRLAIGEAHRRYARHVNDREGWRGFLFQGRFGSFPMDEPHLLAGARYVELNPVRARLVDRPEGWAWSSAAAHLRCADDGLVEVAPLLEICEDWRGLLAGGMSEAELEEIRRHQRVGRPLGDAAFVERLERALGRDLKPRKRGVKARL